MEISTENIIKINSTYKKNIKAIAAKNGFNLYQLSTQLGKTNNYISNACNRKDIIISNNILHCISIVLNCSVSELNDGL